MDVWQFTTINHLSWADIFLFLYFTNFKATCPRIFMKAELWWLPITWAANIGLGMPFVKRRKKEDIIKNPQLALHDKNATIRACEVISYFLPMYVVLLKALELIKKNMTIQKVSLKI